MAFRNDLRYVEILATKFQPFDHGKEIEQSIPERFNLQVGDMFHWSCAQFCGSAEVVARNGEKCTIKKR